MNKKFILMAIIISITSVAKITKPIDNSIREARGGGCTGALAIPDDGYDGSIGSMQCTSFSGFSGSIIDMSLDLSVEHTWVGDLTVKIVAPDSTILTVMNRPGFAETADDGNGGFGDNSDLLSTSVVTFVNGATTSSEDMGVALVNSSDVICQDDGVCDFAPNSGMGEGTDFNGFMGFDALGVWQVCVGDSGSLDTGSLCPLTTSLNITTGSANVAVSPSSGTNINLGSVGTSGSSSVFISNDATATADIRNIDCSITGLNAANFIIDSSLPIATISPGNSSQVDFSASVAHGETLTAVLTCTYEGDSLNSSSTWTLSITGAPIIIPSLNIVGLMVLISLFLSVFFFTFRKIQ